MCEFNFKNIKYVSTKNIKEPAINSTRLILNTILFLEFLLGSNLFWVIGIWSSNEIN